jgi:hypothetical protein
MLFEDLTEDVNAEETTLASPAARMSLLDAYWQDLLTSRQEAEPLAPEPLNAATRELPLPAADREPTAAS